MAFTKRGELENDTATLKQAVEAHNCVLTKWTKAGEPKDWATAKYNLGKALVALGERTQDGKLLEQALAAFRDALSTSGLVVEDEAEYQAGLGDAAAFLGKQERSTAYLQEAVTAYTSALAYYQNESSPKDKETADVLHKKLAEVEARVAQPQGGSSSPAPASEQSVPQPWYSRQPQLYVPFGKCVVFGSNSN